MHSGSRRWAGLALCGPAVERQDGRVSGHVVRGENWLAPTASQPGEFMCRMSATAGPADQGSSGSGACI